MPRIILYGAMAIALLAPPALAQDSGSATAEEVIAEARETYGPPKPAPECAEGEPGEIVVCARLQEQTQFRIRSDERAQDDYARETMFKGDPQAPDVGGPGIFRGKATVSGGCFLNRCPPPPAYIVDFSELPEAPPGSDADRIGRGLPPLGDDANTPAPPSPAVPDENDDGSPS